MDDFECPECHRFTISRDAARQLANAAAHVRRSLSLQSMKLSKEQRLRITRSSFLNERFTVVAEPRPEQRELLRCQGRRP